MTDQMLNTKPDEIEQFEVFVMPLMEGNLGKLDEWKKDGKPCLDTAGWYALCCKIATKDMANLGGIFNIGEAYMEQHPKFTFIAKPNSGKGGEGIFLIDNFCI